MAMGTIVHCGLILSLFGYIFAICPHREHGLKRWSSSRTWPHGKLKRIYISGRMDIGSEDCPYTEPARIILTGRRHEYSGRDHLGMLIGGKVIVVADGGTIEIHGQRKLPWTKLTRTVPKLTNNNGILYDHKTSSLKASENWEHGLVAYIFNIGTHNHVTVRQYGSFEIFSTWQAQSEKAKLTQFIQNVTDGDVLMLAVQRDVKFGTANLSAIFDAFENLAFGSLTGSSVLRTLKQGDAYTAIVQKRAGLSTLTVEDASRAASNDKMHSKLSTLADAGDVKLIVESFVDSKAHWRDIVNFRVVTKDGGYPKIHLVDDVTTWRAGDRVVLTSTDYDWQQAEEAVVVHCSDCSNKELRVDFDRKYEHFGEVIDRVDERGEVALLTRNIKIEGELEPDCPTSNGNCKAYSSDTFGGHFKFLRGATVHIEGAELYHMGQQTDVGRYPFHFHMCFDMRNATHPPYVRENSIHDVFSRCITVHGSHGVMVKDNVCYNTLGHAYFIEDGGEKDTTFDGNLVASVKPGSLLPSDKKPAGFWLTSPLTRMRNNVAAGGAGHGIWYIFPTHPLGPSADKGFLQTNEADHTAYYEFDNNIAHSNTLSGLMADRRLLSDGSDADGQRYGPRVDPLNTSSPAKEVLIYRLTAYKNSYQNSWFRGGWFHVKESSLADSGKAITFARSSAQEQFMSNSVIVGLSKNIGEPAVNSTRSYPLSYDHNYPIQGFTFYDGPVWAKNIWFNGFISTPEYKAGAIGYERNNAFTSSSVKLINYPIQGFTFYDGPVWAKNIWFNGFISTPEYKAGAIGYERNNDFTSSSVSTVRNAKFGFADGPKTGNRVYDGDEGLHGFARYDGDKMATNRDYDSSVTGHHVSHVVKPWPFYTTSACKYRENWNMAICPHTYGKMATNRDYADSVTGYHIAHVVKPWPFYTTSACKYRKNWNMAICPQTYGKIRISNFGSGDVGHTFPVMVRDDIPTINETLSMKVRSADFLVILGGSKTYTLHWTHHVPTHVDIYSDGIQKGKHVRFGVCLPRDATFDLYSYAPHWQPHLQNWISATSLSDLDNTVNDGKKFFHDKTTGPPHFTTADPLVAFYILLDPGGYNSKVQAVKWMLYFKFINMYDRADNETHPCPMNKCPMVQIKNIHGNRNDADCRRRLYHNVRTADSRHILLHHDTSHMPASSSHPPSTWGAGPTKPFINRIPVNGGFGQWSVWASCSLSCGGGHQERLRACDSPIPAHGGTDCKGSHKETRNCNTHHCPIDGGFSNWSKWSPCTNVSGCHGYKKRSRTCTNPIPNYDGEYCHGSDEEVESCLTC